MSDLLWDEVRNFFDPGLMGSLPDLWVEGTSVADWQAVFDLVRSSGWRYEYSVGTTVTPLPPAVEVLSRGPDAEVADLRVWPVDGVLVIFRPYSPEHISFDVDLRELQGQVGVDLLCTFMTTIGHRSASRCR